MSPLRDAVRFIHSDAGNGQARHLQAEPVQLQPLRCDIQQLQLAPARGADPFIHFFAAQGAVDIGSRDPSRCKGVHLILHQ
ncbi:hypothetical protein D3C75_1032320 [compost metagenome]